MKPRLRPEAALPLLLVLAVGCGGAAPLMHPAHPMREDEVTFGGGFSGRVPLDRGTLSPADQPDRALEEGAFAPGFAPWVGARLGLGNDFDAGLTYSGRSIRLDGRHAWASDELALSLGVAGSGLLPSRDEDLGMRIGGFGFDAPILLGYMSDADIYGVWIGGRGGAEYLNGLRDLPEDPLQPNAPLESEDIEGWHAFAGGLVGMRIGFRYVFAVLEVDASMHWAGGTVGAVEVSARQFSVAPAGALVIRF